MRPGREQFHDHRYHGRQKFEDQLRIQTSALRNISDQFIEPVLAEKIDDFLNTSTRLGQIGNGLLNRSLTIVLLLLIERSLEVRSKNAEYRLQLLLCSLDSRKQLGDTNQAVQVLLAAGMVWVLNRGKDALKKAHEGTLPFVGQ